MKISQIPFFLLISILFYSCGKSQEDKLTVDVNTNNKTLKKFKAKDHTTYYSGMNFGGKAYQKVLYLVAANYRGIELGAFNVKPPKGKGDAHITIAVYGPQGTSKEELEPLEIGTYSTHEDETGKKFTLAVIKHDEYNPYGQQETLSGEPVVRSDKVSGTLELTEISQDHATGKLTYAIEGGHSLTMDFSTPITKNLWH